MIKILLTTVITTVYVLLQAQTKIENVRFKQVGNTIEVNYDLYGNGNIYTQLFYSTNNGISWHGPLNSITGDVNNVKQGKDKSITWNVLKEQNWLISDNIKFKVAEKPLEGFFTDPRDNQTYKWVRIGNQIWMAENLRYASGIYITSNSEWKKLDNNNYDAAYCYYDNDRSNKQKYGALYTYAAAKDACPAGWHLPSDAEWTELTDYLGGARVAGGKMKETGTAHWRSPNTGATNESGFKALPGGHRYYLGSFYDLGIGANFWSATERNSSYTWRRYLSYNHSEVRRYNNNKGNGFSVRCVQDN